MALDNDGTGWRECWAALGLAMLPVGLLIAVVL
jgi:hypothetical protein